MSVIPAAMVLTRPGSKMGVSDPGSFGPPGNTPTQRSPPARSARNQVSPRAASETPGASGFGAPNRTRCTITATATATTASPAATANAQTGWYLNEPKKVIASAGNDAMRGTPSKPSTAMTMSHERFGILGPRPLRTYRLRDWARSDSVMQTATINAAASPPEKRERTLPAIASGVSAARPSVVMTPGTIAS